MALRGTSTRACASSPTARLDAIVLARAGLQRLGREPRPARCSTRRASCRRPARARSRSRGAPTTTRARDAVRAITDADDVRVPARRARAGARARRELPHAARRVGRARRLRAACACAPGSACRTARPGSSDELLGEPRRPRGARRASVAAAAAARPAPGSCCARARRCRGMSAERRLRAARARVPRGRGPRRPGPADRAARSS